MTRATSSLPIQSTKVLNSGVPGLIVICGATATGKSGLAIALAQRLRASRLNSAILSADSRQVYREFNIGTAKPSGVDQKLVPHYLIDICDPTETLTVAEYQEQAERLIEEPQALTNGSQASDVNVPLLVGGTGLYIRAITRGLVIPRVPPQPELRSQLQALGQATCYQMLQQVDPQAAQKIHANDEVRTLRSLEVYYTTGCPMSAQQGEHPPTYPILHIGLDCVDPAQLQQRIAQRANHMVAAGLVDEVDYLSRKYGMDLPLLNTLGYAEFKQHLQGQLTQDEALAQTILHTRQFAKRQRTWFRAVPEIQWFNADAPDLEAQVWPHLESFVQSALAAMR
ncbi:MAG: tRNA (adenosine(37)-N6)-dimethylallyltransferase MiaA [Leptolyngbyaceae cyanobacterium bins.349]|nr:tRNA (adenosine(37)-N6)-dimethylallyltransferase MiaA [Leptolyngbyaceae cyanobacterium bins.349]